MTFLRSMVLVVLALLLLGSAGAVGAAEITVKTPTGPVPLGETVVVPITVTGADRLDACDISVTADAPGVAISANTTNPVEGATLTVNTVDNTAKVSFYHLTGVTSDLTLCYVDCTPTASGLSAPVNLTVGCIAEKGSAGTSGDAVSKRYSVVNGTIVTERDPAVATTLAVTPAAVSPLFPGAKQQFAVAVHDQYGSVMDVPATWASSNTTVGIIDQTSGLFTAVGAGSTDVTARAGDRTSGAVTVTVKIVAPAPTQKPSSGGGGGGGGSSGGGGGWSGPAASSVSAAVGTATPTMTPTPAPTAVPTTPEAVQTAAPVATGTATPTTPAQSPGFGALAALAGASAAFVLLGRRD
jgi:PGF-CTERM protein